MVYRADRFADPDDHSGGVHGNPAENIVKLHEIVFFLRLGRV